MVVHVLLQKLVQLAFFMKAAKNDRVLINSLGDAADGVVEELKFLVAHSQVDLVLGILRILF